jgi:hypothetical protein
MLKKFFRLVSLHLAITVVVFRRCVSEHSSVPAVFFPLKCLTMRRMLNTSMMTVMKMNTFMMNKMLMRMVPTRKKITLYFIFLMITIESLSIKKSNR